MKVTEDEETDTKVIVDEGTDMKATEDEMDMRVTEDEETDMRATEDETDRTVTVAVDGDEVTLPLQRRGID